MLVLELPLLLPALPALQQQSPQQSGTFPNIAFLLEMPNKDARVTKPCLEGHSLAGLWKGRAAPDPACWPILLQKQPACTVPPVASTLGVTVHRQLSLVLPKVGTGQHWRGGGEMRACRKGRGGEGSAQQGGGRAPEHTGMGIEEDI